MFIHQRRGWPRFEWDTAMLTESLAAVRHDQGRLLGRLEALGFDLRQETGLATLTEDVVKSSAIEGEKLDANEVRSSIARRLGLDVAGLPQPGRDVEGIVELMLDATRNFQAPLTTDRLFEWHALLFPTGRSGRWKITVGAWRDGSAGPMQVVSSPLGREVVHFEAPEASRVAGEMARFLEWFEAPLPIDPVLRAAIAHFWFVTIHPFDDGNGRIARAIADLLLARADRCEQRFYSMSGQLEVERKDYYSQLEAAQRGDLDLTAWLRWFLGCLHRAIDRSRSSLDAAVARADFLRELDREGLHERQRRVLAVMLGPFEGHLNSSKYAKLARCSHDTALRDIADLVARGALVRNHAGGRSTSYRLATPKRPLS